MVEKGMVKKLKKERQSYTESLQLTMKHEVITRIKASIIIMDQLDTKLRLVKGLSSNSSLIRINLAKIEISQIKNYADNVYSLRQINDGKYIKVYKNFDPIVTIAEVLKLF